MFSQLNPSIPLHVLGKGDGQAFGMIDYGPEHNLVWVTALDDNGEIWCAPNPSVRFQKNWTLGRAESPAISQAKHALHDVGEGLCTDCENVQERESGDRFHGTSIPV